MSELIEITHGYAFKSSDFHRCNDHGRPIVLTPGNFTEDARHAFTEKNTKRLKGEIPERFLFSKGDLTVVMTDLSSQMKILGKPAFVEKENILHNQRIGRVVFKNGELNDRYLYYFLQTDDVRSEIKDSATGTMVRHTAPRRILSLSVPIVPLGEQHRIVAVLDEAFEGLARARAHAEANLQNARELFDEAVSACFRKADELGSERTSLGALAEFRNGLNYTRTSVGRSVKIVGVGDFKDRFKVPIETLSEIKIDGDLTEDDRLQKGDLLAVRSNGNRELIGRTMLVPDLTDDVSFSGFTIRIRPTTDRLLPEYLCEFMRTKATRRILIDGGGGANISNLNQRLLSSLPVCFPSIPDQQSVLEELDSMRHDVGDLVNRYKTKVQHMDDLRQSLLQKAFAGELT